MKIFENLKSHQSVCSMVSGDYFKTIDTYKTTNTNIYKKFVKLVMKSETAIFYWMEKIMKKNIVKLIKYHDSKIITLGVGDGANDIEMLNESHVGVGIVIKQDS